MSAIIFLLIINSLSFSNLSQEKEETGLLLSINIYDCKGDCSYSFRNSCWSSYCLTWQFILRLSIETVDSRIDVRTEKESGTRNKNVTNKIKIRVIFLGKWSIRKKENEQNGGKINLSWIKVIESILWFFYAGPNYRMVFWEIAKYPEIARKH